MNKKLIALAVAGALGAPVAAQAADNVTIYGTLNVTFEQVQASDASSAAAVTFPGLTAGAGSPARTTVTSNSSSLGFKGQEDLGGGLKAWFQLESGYNPVDGSGSGSAFGGRNSGVGLAGNWGTIFLGQWDTPYKAMTTGFGMPFWSTTSAAYNNVIGSPGFNIPSGTTAGSGAGPASTAPGSDTTAARFDRRQANSLQYWTPKWNGFQVKGGYAQEESDNGIIDPKLWSVSATWEGMGLQIGFAYERHEDFFGGLTLNGANSGSAFASGDESTDEGFKVQISYKIQGKYLVGFIWETLEYDTTLTPATAAGRPNALSNLERDAYGFYTILPLNPWAPGEIHAQVFVADDVDCSLVSGAACNNNETGTVSWAIGYVYPFSKRTQIYALYARVNNDDNAQYRLGAGEALPGTVAPGAEPQTFGIGIRHAF